MVKPPRFLSNWLNLTAGTILQQLVGFFALIRIARGLQPIGYGEFTLLTTAVAIAQVVGFLGLPQIITRTVARNPESARTVVRKTAPPVFLGLLFASAILVWYTSNPLGGHVWTSLLLLAFFQGYATLLECVVLGLQRMKYVAANNASSAVVWFLLLLIIPEESFSIELVLWALALSQLCRLLVLCWLGTRLGFFKTRGSTHVLGEPTTPVFLRQGFPIFVSNMMAMIINQFPILLLAKLSDATQVGYYGIGLKISGPIITGTSVLMTAAYPLFVRTFKEDSAGFNSRVVQLFIFLGLAGVILASLLTLFGREIIVTMFGMKYEGSVAPFVVQQWTTVNLSLHLLIGYVLLASNHESAMMRLSIFEVAMMSIGSFMGAHFGAFGMALGGYLGMLLGFAAHWTYLRRRVIHMGDRQKELVLFSSYIIFSVLCILISGAAVQIRIAVGFGMIGLFYFVAGKLVRESTATALALLRRSLVHG